MKTTKIELPTGVIAKDLKHPSYGGKDKIAWNILKNRSSIDLFKTDRFGWCVATLPIGKDRSYGVAVKGGEIVSMGVNDSSKKVTVYLRESRVEALKFLIDLYNKGMDNANSIRDRISTRRANTSLRRSMYGGGLWG